MDDRQAPASVADDLRGLPDADLLTLLARGDRGAPEAIYDRYVDAVWRVALTFSPDERAAARAVSKAFQLLWRTPDPGNRAPLPGRLSLSAWRAASGSLLAPAPKGTNVTSDRDRSRARSPLAGVNEQIDRLHVAFSLADSEFFCECGDLACKERVTLERAQFAALHHESRPVLAPAHADRTPIPDRTVIHELRGEVHRLEGELTSRAVIEQAKGILVERHGLTTSAAFVSIRKRARDERRTLEDVCAETIADAADAELDPAARPGEVWSERGSDDAR